MNIARYLKKNARIVIQSRLRNWQREAVIKIALANDTSISEVTRLALNYFLLHFDRKITSELMDRTEMGAMRKKR